MPLLEDDDSEVDDAMVRTNADTVVMVITYRIPRFRTIWVCARFVSVIVSALKKALLARSNSQAEPMLFARLKRVPVPNLCTGIMLYRYCMYKTYRYLSAVSLEYHIIHSPGLLFSAKKMND